MKKILVVDDVSLNRELLCDILSSKYELDTAVNGQEAIEKLQEGVNYSLILLDIEMPVLNGYEVLNYMEENGLFLRYPVVIISGASDSETERRCFDYAVSDFIAKPYREQIILKRVENVIKLKEYQLVLENEISRQHLEVEVQNRKLIHQASKLQETNEKIIDVLGNIVESRNLESGVHVKRVGGFTKILGLQYLKDNPDCGLTEDQIELISKASALHDIGKISVPDNILLKPGKLTDEEFEIMKTHTQKGCDVLDNIDGIWTEDYHQTTYEICKYHHERYDGKGYPEHLKADEIPISAQLVSVADVYDALVSERCYKAAFPAEDAFQMILSGQCGAFSPKILASFTNARKEFESYARECKK